MKRMEIVVALLAVATLVPATAQAGGSHIHFSLGAPGCGWHGHCHPYPRYVFSYAPPPPVYLYSPPPAVQYVAPSYVPAAAAPATPNWSSRNEPRANTLPASHTVTSTVTIRNPAASGGTVAFVVDNADEVMLNAGQTQTLASKGSYTVEFDRGGDFGVARKTLTSGAYEFQVTERGWDLIDASRVAQRPTVRRNELPDSKFR
jgi:hypothetical protein